MSKYDPRAAHFEVLPGGLVRDWSGSGGPPDEFLEAQMRGIPEPVFKAPTGGTETVTEPAPFSQGLMRTTFTGRSSGRPKKPRRTTEKD
jgi:hypothetical protein